MLVLHDTRRAQWLRISAGRDAPSTSSGDKTAKVWDVSPEGSREWLTFAGHIGGIYDNRVRAIAYSPDGKYLASASQDRTAKIWDAANGRELLTLVGHTDALRSITFSPDGKRVATISDDLTARVWDTTTGKTLFALAAPALVLGFTDHSVAFSPDGKRLAVESENNTAKVWDASSGDEQLTLTGHTLFICAIAFSPDGKRLATASDDETAKCGTRDCKELLTLLCHAGLSSMSLQSGWTRSHGGLMHCDLLDGRPQGAFALTGHRHSLLRGPSAGRSRVATASADTRVMVWNRLSWTSSATRRNVRSGTPQGYDVGSASDVAASRRPARRHFACVLIAHR